MNGSISIMAGKRKPPVPGRGRGRPRADVDLSKLPALCRIQCTAEECASVLGITIDTLDNRLQEVYGCNFSTFYKKHSGGGKCSLRRLQWKAAREGNTTMLVWLGKQWLGQTDKIVHADEEASAQPVQVVVSVVDASVPRADA